MEIKNIINNYFIQPFSTHPKLTLLKLTAITMLAIGVLINLYRENIASASKKNVDLLHEIRNIRLCYPISRYNLDQHLPSKKR
jgi:hypothetical protein